MTFTTVVVVVTTFRCSYDVVVVVVVVVVDERFGDANAGIDIMRTSKKPNEMTRK